MSDVIVNKVAGSGLVSLDLERFLPEGEVVGFDLKDHLFMGLILKEKDFREALKNLDWTIYQDKPVTVTCSADAIIPMWAYMLVASYLQPVASDVYFGTAEEAARQLFQKNLDAIDPAEFIDKRVVIKGCGDLEIGPSAYLTITKKLRPVVKSIMYGEPCSTVPIFKKK